MQGEHKGYFWIPVETNEVKDVTMERFWTWSKQDEINTDRVTYSGVERYIDF